MDLLLLHAGAGDMAALADRIWYPVWDAGLELDHSVRTVKECGAVAARDIRAALGLLDARLVAGDNDVYRQLVDRIRRLWEGKASTWLPEVAQSTRERHEQFGEVAFLLEPQLKEGRGGLRDVQLLRAAVIARPSLGPVPQEIDEAARVLHEARCALHRRAGRRLDQLLLEEQDPVAADLGYRNADALMAAVSKAGSTIAWTGDRLWWTVSRPKAGGAQARLSNGVELRRGEVRVTADPVTAEVVLRAASHAAELGVPLDPPAPVTDSGDPPGPALRTALVGLLEWGERAVPVLETLDRTGLVSQLVPEWELVRSLPQRNPYHRFTVDRHLFETVARAADLTRAVRRPDLLLLAAWLHDIGKGCTGRDHTEAGVELADTILTRLGFEESDVGVVVQLIRHHLSLAHAATRRDINDPAVVTALAEQVRTVEVLDLLEALTEADGLATGPAAWTPWKARLVGILSQRVRQVLAGQPLATSTVPSWVPEVGPPASIEIGPTVRVVGADRPGLLADVAGALAASGLDVRGGRAATLDGMAIEEFDVEPESGNWPDEDRLRQRLNAAVAGTLPLEGLLSERLRAYHRRHPRPARSPDVLFDDATGSTVVEVRASDSLGLLSRVAAALTVLGLDVSQFHATTMGHEAVDAFYVRPLKPGEHAAVRAAIQEAVTRTSERS